MRFRRKSRCGGGASGDRHSRDGFIRRFAPITSSPPLVVAYALAGSMEVDLSNDPLGKTGRETPFICAICGRRRRRCRRRSGSRCARRRCSSKDTARQPRATSSGRTCRSRKASCSNPRGSAIDLYVREAPYFEDVKKTPVRPKDIRGRSRVARFSETRSRPIISLPAGSTEKTGRRRRIPPTTDSTLA